MSHGARTPLIAQSAYSTTGASSFVSHPSTRTWNPSTITIVIQYAGLRNNPVRNTHSSSSTTTTAAADAATRYSSTIRQPTFRTFPHRLVGQQRADRDRHEEQHLLDRQHAAD